MTSDNHLSDSQMNSMTRCEYAFLRRYGYGDRSPPSWAMTAGSAIDAGANLDYGQKIDSHENLPVEDVVSAVVDDFRKRNDSEEVAWGSKGMTEDTAVDMIAPATRVLHEEAFKVMQPLRVQQKFEVTFKNAGFTFIGFIDLIAEQGWYEQDAQMDRKPGFVQIVDLKATGKSGGWKQNDVLGSVQYLAYDLGVRHALGLEPEGFEFHVMHYANSGRAMKVPVLQVLAAPIDDEQRAGFLKLIAAKAKRKNEILTSGIGLPNYDWHCAGCGFRAACKKEWGKEPPK